MESGDANQERKEITYCQKLSKKYKKRYKERGTIDIHEIKEFEFRLDITPPEKTTEVIVKGKAVKINALFTSNGKIFLETGSRHGVLRLLPIYPKLKYKIIGGVMIPCSFYLNNGAYEADSQGRINRIYINSLDTLLAPFRGDFEKCVENLYENIMKDIEEHGGFCNNNDLEGKI
jgi:hypothetical protein